MEVRTWKFLTAFLCSFGFSLALSRAQKEGSVVPLTETKVVEFGDLFVLNCSTIKGINVSSCDIQYNSSLRYDYRDVGLTWKAFVFVVNNWSFSASCFVNCTDNEISYQETIVTVYQPPESVELGPWPEMEVGKPYNLTCWVSRVAPIQKLTVTLLKGAEQLLVKNFENHTAPEAGAVVVSHLIIPQPNDHNKAVTCQTSLDLRPRGPLLRNTSHSISLRSFRATAKISEETVFPQNRVVTRGDPVWLNYSPTSDPLIDWSPYKSPEELPSERTMKESYQPLEQITLEIQKSLPGQSWVYNLICRIIRVDPCHSLSVTFFKGSKRLALPRFTNCTWSAEENCTFTLHVTLHPEDHGQEAYCLAAVYFTLHEPAYQTKSSELSLKTAESYLALIVAATSAAALLASVLVVFLIFTIRLWIY